MCRTLRGEHREQLTSLASGLGDIALSQEAERVELSKQKQIELTAAEEKVPGG